MSNSQNLRYTLSPFARTEYDNDNIGQDQIFSRFSCQFIGFHNRTNGDQSCTNLFEFKILIMIRHRSGSRILETKSFRIKIVFMLIILSSTAPPLQPEWLHLVPKRTCRTIFAVQYYLAENRELGIN